jgi:hypothetical protein
MRYFLTHNDVIVNNYGIINDNQFIQTGQKKLEFFNEIDELKNRLLEFNVTYVEIDNKISPVLNIEGLNLDGLNVELL